MGWPWHIPKAGIIFGALISVLDDCAEGSTAANKTAAGSGRSACISFLRQQSRKDLRKVLLLPCGGIGVLSRSPPLHEGLYRLHVEALSCGDSIHHHSDALGMGLTENGDPYIFTVFR